MGTTPLWLSWNSLIDPKNEIGVEQKTGQAKFRVSQHHFTARDHRAAYRNVPMTCGLI